MFHKNTSVVLSIKSIVTQYNYLTWTSFVSVVLTLLWVSAHGCYYKGYSMLDMKNNKDCSVSSVSFMFNYHPF